MKRKEILFILAFFIFVAALFFNKLLFQGLIPFPGDLLVSEYSPWKTYSYLGYTPGSIPSKFQYFDTIRQIYPWQTFSIAQLREGQLPLWNPYNFSGAPLLANVQSAIFYPLKLFYAFLPQEIAWSILIVLQPFLASLFAFLFAREIGLSKIPSIFAGVAFGYSLFMSTFLEYNTVGQVIVWLPLLLFAIEKILKGKMLFSILFVASIVFSFFAGHLQLFAFMFLFASMYVLFKILATKGETLRGRIFYICILTLLAIGITSIQLFPTLELINNAARSTQEYTFLIGKLLIQPSQLILFLSPDFFGNPATKNYLLSDSYPGNALYIGLIPCIFALFALVRVRNTYIRFFGIASILLLLLFLRTPFSELFYKIQIPLFSTGSPTNGIFLLVFSLSILAGFGLEEWIKRADKWIVKITAVTTLICIFIGASIFLFHPQISTKNFFYSCILLFVFIALQFARKYFGKGRYIGILFVIITILDLFYFFQKFNPFVPGALVFPKTEVLDYIQKEAGINRFWGYGGAAIDANFASQFSLFSPDGYDPLYPKAYGQFIQASKDGNIAKDFTNQTRSDALVVRGFGQEDLMANPYRLKVLDILGVRYVLDRVENGSSEKTFPSDRFHPVYERDGWKIFENKKALERALFIGEYKTYNNEEEFTKMFFSKDFDPRKTILLEKNIDDTIALGTSKISVRLYKPNEVIFDVTTDTSQLLLLSDTYYPGWQAFVDGVETKIYRANYAFRAVRVQPGNHVVSMVYQPASFSLGVKASIISSIGFGLVVVALWFRKKHIHE